MQKPWERCANHLEIVSTFCPEVGVSQSSLFTSVLPRVYYAYTGCPQTVLKMQILSQEG